MKNKSKIIMIIVIALLIITNTGLVVYGLSEDHMPVAGTVEVVKLKDKTYLGFDEVSKVIEIDTIAFNYNTIYAKDLNDKYNQISNDTLNCNILATKEDEEEYDEDILENQLLFECTDTVSYVENKDIGSVLLTNVVNEFDEDSLTTYYTDNINIKTGLKISNLDLLNLYELEVLDVLEFLDDEYDDYRVSYRNPIDFELETLNLFIDENLDLYNAINVDDEGILIKIS